MRLDQYLLLEHHFSSRTKAQQAIRNGLVQVNGICVKKTGTEVQAEQCIQVQMKKQFASIAAQKLLAAWNHFAIPSCNRTVMDVGASNGGFTQVLLEHGAKKVYAIDVGKSQLQPNLLQDSRVVVLDHCNARNLTPQLFDDQIDLATIDVSFISLRLILQAVTNCIKDEGEILALIKPQFEVKKEYRNKHGIVTNDSVIQQMIERMILFASSCKLQTLGCISVRQEQEKNNEHMIWLKKEKITAHALI